MWHSDTGVSICWRELHHDIRRKEEKKKKKKKKLHLFWKGVDSSAEHIHFFIWMGLIAFKSSAKICQHE